jgi:RNA polymerase sigma-70 factor (ECF subfamily)
VEVDVVALFRDQTSEALEDWPEDEERALAVRARIDPGSFGQLYDHYVDRIYAYCYRRLQSREAAEDATSDTFVKAMAAIAGFRPEAGSFRAWLFTIAHRVVIDAWRGSRPHASLDGIGEIPELAAGPEHLAIAREATRDVYALVALLPEDQATVVHLRLAGLTDREIAEVLGRSHGAIRIAQHRANKRLQALATAGADTARTQR